MLPLQTDDKAGKSLLFFNEIIWFTEKMGKNKLRK